MKYVFPLVLVSLSCLTGCLNTEEAMNSWLGQSEASLIAQWGPPPFVRDDGQGGHVLVYGNFNGAYRMFYVNSSGTVYSWRSRGR